MVDPVLRQIAAKDAHWSIHEVGLDPWTVAGTTVPLRGADGRFSGNCLRHVWYPRPSRNLGRPVSTEYPRRSRGGAATRLRGIPA